MALIIVLFIVLPIAELYVIIQVGSLIGVWPTLALLLASALLGSMMLRHQGRSAWRRFNEALAARRFPGREVADGAMILVGGTLLVTPGFITDAVGLALLFPPTRAIARRLMRPLLIRRFAIVSFPTGTGQGPTRAYDYEGTAEEAPAEDPQLPR